MIPILNVLWKIVAGERYDYKDPRMKSLMQMLIVLFEANLQRADATWFLPFLAKIFPQLERGVEGLKGKPGDIKHFLNETIQHHKDTLDINNTRDFIDAYLMKIMVIKGLRAWDMWRNLPLQDKGNEESSFNEDVGYENLVNVLIDLFTAGTDTTSLTLTFGIIFLTK